MATNDEIALFTTGVIVIEGVWLAGLTYLMWRRYLREREKKRQEAKEQPPNPPT